MTVVNFDRAAGFYDQTRAQPAEVSQAISAALLAILPPEPAVLEVGIGTGRIARPLLQRGLAMFGIDVSAKMMQRLVEAQTAGEVPARLALADAHCLPFAPASFDAVLAVHVFHLLADWRTALGEVRRTLRPQGMLLAGSDTRAEDSPQSRIRHKWDEIAQAHGQPTGRQGIGRIEDLKAALLSSGAECVEIEAANWMTRFVPNQYIDDLANGIYSSTWGIDPEVIPECSAEIHVWAAATFGDLAQPVYLPRKFVWSKFTWNNG
jgi:SAM-dependent methyltransferase